MAKQNLRVLIENIVIEALEEWMDECECDDFAKADDKAGVKSFGGGEVEKKSKNECSKKKNLPPAFLENFKKARSKCARCGKIKYLPAAGIDRSESYLCDQCDDMFIAFTNKDYPEGGFRSDDPLARFLRMYPYRTS